MPSKKTLKRHISDARVRMAGFSGMPFLLKTMLLGSSERKDILRARETNLLLRLKKLQKKKTSRKTTANEMKLDDPKKVALYNRFKQVFVDYPPVKDEMMIAAVWMADRSGILQISNFRQSQLVSFFTILLPELRNLFRKGQIA